MSLQDVKDKIAANEPLLFEDLLVLVEAGEDKLEAAQAALATARQEDWMPPTRDTHATPGEAIERLGDIKKLIGYTNGKINEINRTVTPAQDAAVKELVEDMDL